jgi:pimeloyl-ACP methyl ester carboxylesterase
VSSFVQHRGGSGSPLVLLHGFTDTWHTWKPVVPALEREHEVFVPALPGHVGGYEFTEDAQFSIAACIDALERDLDAVGIDRAHMVGNSLGGWAALHLAARGRALSVVGISPAGGWKHGSREGKRVARFFGRNYRMLRIGGPRARLIASRPRLKALAMRDIAARPAQIPAEAALQYIRGAYECPAYLRALKLSREEGLGDLPGPIPDDLPVRIAWGSRDRILRWPAYAERFHRLVPNADWVELEGLGHVPMWDDRELVARTILDFTAAHEPALAPT